MWPQTEVVEETLAPPQTPVVTAPEPIVAEVKLGTEPDLPTEKEKAATPQLESPRETTNESEPAPVEASATPNTRPTAESEHVPEPIPAPAPAQAVTNLQPGDMVYVEGFGCWNTKGQITVNTARTFTKTVTKSVSWADLKNCAA